MADTTAPAGKPDLKATHARLRTLNQFLLELAARARAAGASAVTITTDSLESQARVVTQSVMDLEPYLA